MTRNDRAIIATVAGVIWDEYPISAGRTQYTVYGLRFIAGKETHEQLGEFFSYSAARQCERSAYYHEFTWIKQAKLCLLTDRSSMTWADRDAFVRQAMRDNRYQ